jgi:calpain-15
MLGDCYLLSALSSMAENPSSVADCFITKQTNSCGIYLLLLYINGVRTPVIVDDYLPCINGRLCFARSKGEELWVCLLEKAWAKLYGTYARIERGDPGFAMSHLTGNPAETVWHEKLKDNDKFWE